MNPPRKSMTEATFARGSATSAARMKMRVGVQLGEHHVIVEGGKRITTGELIRSVNQADDRFLRERYWRSHPVKQSQV